MASEKKHKVNTNNMLSAMMDFSASSDTSWEEELMKDQSGQEMVIPQPDEHGNYSSPALEVLKATWDKFFGGTIAEEEIVKTLQDIFNTIELQLKKMDLSCEELGDSAEAPANKIIAEAFEQHMEAIEIMDEYFQSSDRAKVDEGMKLAQKATNRLMEGFNRYMEDQIKAWTILCPSCAAENIRGTEKCVKCFKELPIDTSLGTEQSGELLLEEGSMLGTGAIELMSTPNYERVAESVASFKDRIMTEDELKSVLDEVKQTFVLHLDNLAREDVDSGDMTAEEKKFFRQLTDLTRKGLKDSLTAVENIEEFFTDRNPKHLEVGVSDLFEATQVVAKSYIATEEAMLAASKNTEAAGVEN